MVASNQDESLRKAYRTYDKVSSSLRQPYQLGVLIFLQVLLGAYLIWTWTELIAPNRPTFAALLLLGITIYPIRYLVWASRLLAVIQHERKLATNNKSRDADATKGMD